MNLQTDNFPLNHKYLCIKLKLSAFTVNSYTVNKTHSMLAIKNNGNIQMKKKTTLYD